MLCRMESNPEYVEHQVRILVCGLREPFVLILLTIDVLVGRDGSKDKHGHFWVLTIGGYLG